MGIKLNNSSRYLEQKGDTHWWEWTAFIESTSPDKLADIKYVEYHLHPTFIEPIKRRRNANKKFSLTTVGWGTFLLKAVVYFKDSSKKPKPLEHYLEFEGVE